MKNKKQKTIIGGIIATALSGTMYLGAEIGRPECDYVIIRQDDKHICLTMEQAEAIAEGIELSVEGTGGFGGVKFGKKSIDIIKK